MSANAKATDAKSKAVRRLTIPKLMAHKGDEPLVCLTAYTAPMAGLLDPHCEILLVGDSVGMVLYGMDTTLAVTLDMMIAHGRAVVRASQHAVVIIDMPFGSYEESPEMAFRNCARALSETGAQGIKLEGGSELAPTIRFLTQRGIPVMAHIGLTPQSVNTLGGFITQGKQEADRARLIADAKAVAEAGAFSTVLEAVAQPLGKAITDAVPNLTIGIGASADCDGQILVTDDMLGMFSWNAKFVKRYAELRNVIDKAVAEYAAEVRARSFPGEEHTYKVKSK